MYKEKKWVGWNRRAIFDEKAKEFIEEALSIAATLLKIPEDERDQERFFEELEPEEEDDDEKYNHDNRFIDDVVRQQDHNHELDFTIAELCSDVEVAFFEPRMWW